MLHLKLTLFGVAIFLGVVLVALHGDDKKEVPQADQVKILKAQHAVDEIESKKAQLALQFTQLNNQLQDLRQQYSALEQPGRDAQKSLDDAIQATAKTMGIDMAKFTFDRKDLVFVPNPPPAPPAPAPLAPSAQKK
jgi:F0F1-type ATP synthase membrane subunit b/b'